MSNTNDFLSKFHTWAKTAASHELDEIERVIAAARADVESVVEKVTRRRGRPPKPLPGAAQAQRSLAEFDKATLPAKDDVKIIIKGPQGPQIPPQQ